MRRITITLAAAMTATLTTLGTLAAAPVQAADGTAILDPADGADIPAGTQSVTVLFGATDSYEVDVDGPSGYYDWANYAATAGETRTFSNLDPMSVAGDYRVTVYDGAFDVVVTSDFTVGAAPVKVTNPAARPSDFYPVVRDRYKDSAAIAYTLNRRADVSVHVYRVADGKRVRAINVGSQGSGRRQWTWNGFTNAGSPVGAGKYRVEIKAKAADGTSATARTTVAARTTTVTRRGAKAVRGNRATSTSRRGNCYVDRDAYFGETRLDCWAGAHAQATYRFAIPANARNLVWRVRGEKGCCDEGKLTRTGTRVSPRSYRIVVRVTNWRAFTVRRASVSYSYRDRI